LQLLCSAQNTSVVEGSNATSRFQQAGGTLSYQWQENAERLNDIAGKLIDAHAKQVSASMMASRKSFITTTA
jgi:hypothetical protein